MKILPVVVLLVVVMLQKRKSTSSTTTTTTGGQVKDDTRRLAQASRTLKACELCRKQKTRCSRSIETSNSCLRCIFLNKNVHLN